MDPRDLVRICILVSFGAIVLAVAAWMLSFAFSGASASPFGLFVVLGAVVLLGGGLLLLGGAGADAASVRWNRWRGKS